MFYKAAFIFVNNNNNKNNNQNNSPDLDLALKNQTCHHFFFLIEDSQKFGMNPQISRTQQKIMYGVN